ncbi:MAG: hypothetical protein ACKPKO_08270, partial [Candidatus Fonsibacter sp.]
QQPLPPPITTIGSQPPPLPPPITTIGSQPAGSRVPPQGQRIDAAREQQQGAPRDAAQTDRASRLKNNLSSARTQNPAQSASRQSIVDTAKSIFTYLTRQPAAVPPSEDLMFMSNRQVRNHLRRNRQSASSSSGPVPPHPPIYPPAQTQVPTGVPVIAINSSSEAQMTPEQVDEV